MRKLYHATSKAAFRFFSPALPDKLPDAMRISPILSMVVGAALVYWKPIPIQVTVICIAGYLLVVCLYIKGFNLTQAEAKAAAEQAEAAAEQSKDAAEHKRRMDAIEEERKQSVKFTSGNAHPKNPKTP